MIPWDAKNLRWFREAGEVSGYHRQIAELLAQRLAPCQDAYDLGAGSGDLALALAKLGFRVTAVEQQRAAVDSLAGRIPEAGLSGRVVALCGDWTVHPGPPADAAVLSYCGGVLEDWPALRRLCRKKLAVLTGRPKTGPPFDLIGFPDQPRVEKRDAPEAIRAALVGYGVAFTEEPLVHDFGQVARDEADLADFLRAHHGDDIAARAHEAAARCRRLPDGRLYLPIRREAVLFIVEMPGVS